MNKIKLGNALDGDEIVVNYVGNNVTMQIKKKESKTKGI